MTCGCPYCNQPAKLVHGGIIYPHRRDLVHKKFWFCKPCGAWVGCHDEGKFAVVAGEKIYSDGTLPLGRLANAELRRAKSEAHEAFDPIWKTKKLSRTAAYTWLATQLGIAPDECHIGLFDIGMCQKVVLLSRNFL